MLYPRLKTNLTDLRMSLVRQQQQSLATYPYFVRHVMPVARNFNSIACLGPELMWLKLFAVQSNHNIIATVHNITGINDAPVSVNLMALSCTIIDDVTNRLNA